MGSLKDEMRGLGEDHQPCEKTDGGVPTGGSDITDAPEGHQLHTGHEEATHGDFLPQVRMNASPAEETDKNPTSKDQALSGGDCSNTDQSHNTQDKDCIVTDEGGETKRAPGTDATVAIKFLSDGGEGPDLKKDENKSPTRENNDDLDKVLVPVPSTPNPSNPCSPAPFGQQHMRTQVSLEVVQCCSVATSPMTPPEGGNSFFFPSSFGKFGTADGVTKDAELQVGQKVEFCSVATSPFPMTPKIPATTAFPELTGGALKDEKAPPSEEKQESVQQESFASTKESREEAESEKTEAFEISASKELNEVCNSNASPDPTTKSTASGIRDSQGTVGDNNQQCKQPRMGSLDQDITILVTHYANDEEGEEDNEESSPYFTEPDMPKLDETEEEGELSNDVKTQEGKETISTETNDGEEGISSTSNQENKTAKSSDPVDQQPNECKEAGNSDMKENTCDEPKDVSLTKPLVPESPAPFGCHNIRTQVSLEVVQCQSAATSPMTPPEGEQAFYFPSSVGKCTSVGTEMKDAEMQVGQKVEFRSVATAPMTPRTPTAMTFPEVRKEKSIEEKIVEEEEDVEDQEEEKKEEAAEEKEKITEEKKEEAAEQEVEKEAASCQEKDEEKCEEPVQEVSWDEKGMTWEVYGAVVEVAVLGSAIQKHLEKQVKKQKMQASLPPPPPLNPAATPLSAEPTPRGSGSGKSRSGKRMEKEGKVGRRRRNPFRQLMENMQQPHCCSRAHTTE
ncbi:unnamed protein product [Ophioblennius macclurei]